MQLKWSYLFESDTRLRQLERKWHSSDDIEDLERFVTALRHYGRMDWNRRDKPLPFGTEVTVIASFRKPIEPERAKVVGHRRGSRDGWVYDLSWESAGIGGAHEDFVFPRGDVT